MKKLFIILTVFTVGNLFSQKMITKTGEIKFEASMPAFEEVAATNKTASCIFDISSGEFAALTLIKAFKFKSPLMEEHFNENYMESSKFPKATFKGKIANFDSKKISATKTEFDLEGDLTIHGVTKKVKVKISLVQNGTKVQATSVFNVKAVDYKIDIPSVVKSKIAENIKISLNFGLEKN